MTNIFKNLQKNKYMEYFPDFKRERTQQFITLVLTFISLIFLSLVAINPTLSTIAKLRREVADSEFVEQSLRTKIQNLSLLSQNYRSVQKDIPIVLDAVPSKPDATSLIAYIQSVATETGVSVTSLDVSPIKLEKTSKEKSSFVISITMLGDYTSFSRFLSSISNIQRILSIDSVSIEKLNETETSLKMSIKTTAFYKE